MPYDCCPFLLPSLLAALSYGPPYSAAFSERPTTAVLSYGPSYLLLFIPWGGVSSREQRSRARSRRGGVSKNWTEGATAARLIFLTAVAIAIATKPFKFHEISVSNSSSSFVSSIHSFALDAALLFDVNAAIVGWLF